MLISKWLQLTRVLATKKIFCVFAKLKILRSLQSMNKTFFLYLCNYFKSFQNTCYFIFINFQ